MQILKTENRATLYTCSLWFPQAIYDPATTYNKGDKVVAYKDESYYESQKDSNKNHEPTEDSGSNWKKIADYKDYPVEAEWDSGTTYNTDDIVFKYDSSDNNIWRVYKSKVDSNKNNNPNKDSDNNYWDVDSMNITRNYKNKLWDSSKNYNTDDLVTYIDSSDNIGYVYKSLVDSNNSEPTKTLDWEQISPENGYKSFDLYLNTYAQGEKDKKVIFWYKTTRTDYFAVLRTNAISVDVTYYLDDGSSKAYHKDAPIAVDNWEDYFYNDIIDDDELYNIFVPTSNISADCQVVLNNYAEHSVTLGKAMLGYAQPIGVSLFGATGRITDYSKVETDKNGNTYLKQGNWATETEAQVEIKTCTIDKVFRTFAKYRAKPMLYLSGAEDRFNSLNVYGYYKTFSILLSNPVLSKCSLTLQGLI